VLWEDSFLVASPCPTVDQRINWGGFAPCSGMHSSRPTCRWPTWTSKPQGSSHPMRQHRIEHEREVQHHSTPLYGSGLNQEFRF
jgi:hypothetical protein